MPKMLRKMLRLMISLPKMMHSCSLPLLRQSDELPSKKSAQIMRRRFKTVRTKRWNMFSTAIRGLDHQMMKSDK